MLGGGATTGASRWPSCEAVAARPRSPHGLFKGSFKGFYKGSFKGYYKGSFMGTVRDPLMVLSGFLKGYYKGSFKGTIRVSLRVSLLRVRIGGTFENMDPLNKVLL